MRRAFDRILPEEIAHARLAADIDRFVMRRLPGAQRALVRHAGAAAHVELERPARIAAPDAEREVGLPHVYERAAIAARSARFMP